MSIGLNFVWLNTVSLVIVIIVLLISYVALPKKKKITQYFSRNKKWLSPNHISYWRIYGVIPITIGLYYGLSEKNELAYYLAVWGFAFLAATDGLDGQVARCCNQLTTKGAKLDALADKFLDLPVLMILCLVPNVEISYILLVAGIAIFDIIGQNMRGTHSPAEAGIVGKAKTTTKFIVIYLMSLVKFPDVYEMLILEIFIPVLLIASLILAGLSMGMKTKWYQDHLRKYIKEYLGDNPGPRWAG